MRLWVLVILTILIPSTSATFSKSSWGLENEALIVRCPRQEKSRYPVVWYYSKTNKRITTQRRSRVVASGERLKFLPAKVNDSGFYTCIIRSPTSNKTGYVNVTIYKKQPGCDIPDFLIYSTTSGSGRNSKIYCPTIDLYNWTAPVEWFKNCEALQGSRYRAHKSFLLIDNANSKDIGDYTCKFMHYENGVNYTVTATRSFTVIDKRSFSLLPVIIAPPQNETKEVEIGKPANLSCSACFGKGSQTMADILWQVNRSNVENVGEARIQVSQEQNQSSPSELTCLNAVLRIAYVKEEDLSLKYDCLAVNFRGLVMHTIRLRRKNPMDQQSTYYMLAGFSILFLLINVLVILLKTFWIEIILLWRDIARPHKTRNDGKTYDAYVIYPRNCKNSPEGASSVEYFVHQILPDVLENKCGYDLYIYGRDLLPGEDVATTVETSIQKSRRHIFILTPEVMHSEEFAYEWEIALHNTLIQNDCKAILIEMEALCPPSGLQFGELQDSLKHLVKVQGTIKWREDLVANKQSLNSKFWKHIRYHMPVPSKLPRKTPRSASSSARDSSACFDG
ncbi:interleukin-1 receptor-like 1 [Physeter macrocephalus]|uniref:Interleukin-1 receptor-like 1 n=1 Tax=Physeter macrocephalus TaxID=9755 RepID=A0A9W2X0N3_PHYMC|nr:interleukin-1 receptor-like 1 [Physeter catodon]|eukprot:XP_007118580.2 interleukin-1 receptor-like 1 [Physeter catodon]